MSMCGPSTEQSLSYSAFMNVFFAILSSGWTTLLGATLPIVSRLSFLIVLIIQRHLESES